MRPRRMQLVQMQHRDHCEARVAQHPDEHRAAQRPGPQVPHSAPSYMFPTLVPSDLFDTHMLLSLLYSRAVLSVYDSAIADLKAAGMQILVTSGEGGGHYEDIRHQADTRALPHQLFTPAIATHCAVPVP
jgi:hypothetical protein